MIILNNMQTPQENPNYGVGHSENEWTTHENKLFENALAELDLSSPSLFQRINAILPSKTPDQIKIHFEKLIEDVMAIENDQVPLPNYGRFHRADNNHERKGVPWTEEEHKSFLVGLSKFGKGEWRNISKYYVPSKTPSQVASHAQKYFRRVKCSTPIEKRRHSIHDIRIHNSSIVETPARYPNHHAFIAHIAHDRVQLDPPSRSSGSSSSSDNNDNNNLSQNFSAATFLNQVNYPSSHN